MAEQTFRSPGFFEQEIDLSARKVSPLGTPAGVIGVSERGPAFVPITVGSFSDFENKFGSLNTDMAGPYAVKEFLEHKSSLTFMRLLGAGDNKSSADITNTLTQGTVKNAGFRISGSAEGLGTVQFLAAEHTLATSEFAAYPVFTDNSSFPRGDGESLAAGRKSVNLIRGMLMTATGSNFQLLSATSSLNKKPAGKNPVWGPNLRIHNSMGGDSALVSSLGSGSLSTSKKYFKLALLSNSGKAWASDETFSTRKTNVDVGNRVFTCSLDPADDNYISKVLNTDPRKFQEEEHLLYAHFPVEHNVASIRPHYGIGGDSDGGLRRTVFLMSGSSFANTEAPKGTSKSHQTEAGVSYEESYSRFDTRYTTPRTTSFISQPIGKKEWDLFHFETIDDGAFANSRYKISIANLRVSTDDKNEFGTFTVQLRSFSDTDVTPRILESYPGCSLDPNSSDYIAKKIGDKKVRYDFDQETDSERRLVVTGRFANVSARVRVIMNQDVDKGLVPKYVMPFGFRGIPLLKTSDTLTDRHDIILSSSDGSQTLGQASLRLYGSGSHRGAGAGAPSGYSGPRITTAATCSILPPMPFRFKVTRGEIKSTFDTFLGQAGTNERADSRYYWGVKTDRVPRESEVTNGILQSNGSTQPNHIVENFTKFLGIQKLGSLVTGSAADEFNNNKFSLSRVVFSNKGTMKQVPTMMSGTANEHMLEACYVRNGALSTDGLYKIDARDGTAGANPSRYTLATLIASGAVVFNRFSDYAKFTNVFYGGFDGLNTLDRDQSLFKDRALSSATGGKAQKTPSAALAMGLPLISSENQSGYGRRNNNVASIRTAIDIMTDPFSSRINILAIPGARDAFVTDYALRKTREYQKAIYLMDSLVYDEDGNRLYDDSKAAADVRQTVEKFESRRVDNNYAATFFPDVVINDATNNRLVKVPSSVAAIAALSFNDKEKKPWFAPAGFNRGGLSFVTAVQTRLSSNDRDKLYDARINPIASFPRAGFVIFGQKTLQQSKSALDRINVRRLMLEIKRLISGIGQELLFEPNTPQTRSRFVTQATRVLALIQAGAGVDQFSVVMDDSNNSKEDIEQNRLNGKIVVVPTRSVEFISIDFIITNNGVEFV